MPKEGHIPPEIKQQIIDNLRCTYSDAYILMKRTITFYGAGADTAARQASSIQIGGIRTFFPLEHTLVWRNWDIIGSKNQTTKIDKIHKDFELYQAFTYNFLSQTVPVFPIHMSFTKIIKSFWSTEY